MSNNGYQDGYSKGYSDGKSGRGLNSKPPIIKSVASRDNYMQEYMSGYREGYGIGCRDKARK